MEGTGRANREVTHPTRAVGWPPPAEPWRRAAQGELKFKCDPRRGRRRELTTAREGPRAQEASALKGPARLSARPGGLAAGS